eukprot:TRINITY_DN305_c0_g1_i1.p1 TRINITY_DN305_c0_g1~~TRINITY_DN305_c0_g1_i1.p1  ORF type:complete len:433 (+),score=144.28 TRINITY_DN305_c0_g1_i1:68-1300(+)
MRPRAALLVAGAAGALCLDNGMLATPPMGWSSWNKYACGINETLIRSVADAMASSGLRAAGYDHVNLDDCWMAAERAADGSLLADSRFPSGMKALGDYLHSKGFKYGLYLDPGTLTCQRRAGTLGHEQQDADYLASVGCDYLKYDSCYDSAADQLSSYFRFRDALNATGRRIGYSICPDRARCNDPRVVMWDASSVANVNMCRGDQICKDYGLPDRPRELFSKVGDIKPTWHSWLCMLDVQAEFESTRYAGPGHYVMPDMLEVGNGMTDAEDRAHFSMWAMIAAPLIAGHDIVHQSAASLATLTNREVIAIDQDPMGKPARRVRTGGYFGADVWTRQLAGGDYAAALFNRGNSSAADITLQWADVGLPDEQPAQVRDVWAGKDVGLHNTSYTAAVPPHSVVLLRISQRPG